MVSPAGTAADIGTDHAYVPVYLVQQKKVSRAVAMDVNPGPLSRARRTVEAAGLKDQIDLRLSDGLTKLRAGEAECIILAGMGGALITRLLREGLDRCQAAGQLVLAPQSETELVRRFLREQGFVIDREDMVLEDGKFYPVIHAVSSGHGSSGGAVSGGHAAGSDHAAASDYVVSSGDAAGPGCVVQTVREVQAQCGADRQEPENRQELEDRYGPLLLRSRHPVLKQYLQKELRTKEKIRQQLEQAGEQEGRRREVIAQAAQISGILADWKKV